jgi:hypothetical protein
LAIFPPYSNNSQNAIGGQCLRDVKTRSTSDVTASTLMVVEAVAPSAKCIR